MKSMVKVWGKEITRDEAIEIILSDAVDRIIHAGDSDLLREMMMGGWSGLENWPNSHLAEFMEDLITNEKYIQG